MNKTTPINSPGIFAGTSRCAHETHTQNYASYFNHNFSSTFWFELIPETRELFIVVTSNALKLKLGTHAKLEVIRKGASHAAISPRWSAN